MKPEERWQQIEQLCHAALERPAEERAAFVAAACGADEALRQEVESLLAYDEQGQRLLKDAPDDLAAGWLAWQQAGSVVGQQIGHYQILSLLGAGGMGEVYLGQDARLKRKIALKLLPAKYTQDRARVLRFEREAQAASALNHPNILTIYEIGQLAETHFIVTEYIEGQTLRQRLSHGRVELVETLEAAVQIASALAAAHAAGVVHRDIKPENIMLRPDGLVKVLDFGLAKLTEQPAPVGEAEFSTAAQAETNPGIVMGTLRYMSPEQARGQKVDARSDLFSLGVVIYELLAGQAPFAGATSADIIAAILEKEPAPLVQYRPDAPDALEGIVMKALRKEREERYQTASELLSDLKRLKQHLELEPELKRAKQAGANEAATEIESSGRVSGAADKIPSTAPAAFSARLFGSKKRRAAFALAALLIGGVGIAAVVPLVRQPAPPEPSPPRALTRLTFDPGLQSEPTWSPEGRLIAYSSDRSGNFDIWVQQADGSNPVQVTRSAAHDWQPDWSPDGKSIAFRSEREGGGLFIVPALGGHERKVASFGYRPRWSPDGAKLLFTGSALTGIEEPPHVYVVALDGAPPRQMLPELTARMVSHLSVDWHPDGKRLSLWARPDFWTVPLDGGAPMKSEFAPEVERQIEEAGVILDNFQWAPNAQALYFEGAAKQVKNIWRVAVEPQTLRWVRGPTRLTAGLGQDTDIALSADGRKLALTTRSESTRIWSLPFDARTGQLKGAGQPITAPGIQAVQFDLSRDGRKLAYVAKWAGSEKEEIRVKALADGRESVLVADELDSWMLRWARDNTRLVYARVRWLNPKRAQGEVAIVVLPESGGAEQVLATAVAELGPYDWSADDQWLLVSCEHNDGGARQISICALPVAAAPHAEKALRRLISDRERLLFQSRYSPNERWICFIATKPGISTIEVIPAEGGAWRAITTDQNWADKPRWSPDGRTIYFLSNRGGGLLNVWGRRFDPEQGQPLGEPFRVTTFEGPGRMVSPLIAYLEMALVENQLVLPITEVTGSIWVLENADR